MKYRLLSLCFIVALLVACNDSDDFAPEIDVRPIHTVSNREQILKIPVASNTDWILIKENCRWCITDKSHGIGNDTITLCIAENIDYKERMFSIVIENTNVSRIIKITQQAAMEEYHYKLPVIFHILYDDSSNPQQNVDADIIAKAIEGVNAYYRNKGNSVDMNLEFVLATHDPHGNLLKEPGIERIFSDAPTEMNSYKFMRTPENTSYIWDLNRYINIFTFPFIEKNILGIANFPFTVGYDPLIGLNNGDMLIECPTALTRPQCIVLNNSYVLTEHSVLEVPDVHLTLAHELGHYMGLIHVFTTDDQKDDYCDDTPTYDREAYENWLNALTYMPKLEELTTRTSTYGVTFISYNIMDYDFSYLNQFTPDQRKRMRHVLENSPLIPGPKHTDYRTRGTLSTEIPQQRFTQ